MSITKTPWPQIGAHPQGKVFGDKAHVEMSAADYEHARECVNLLEGFNPEGLRVLLMVAQDFETRCASGEVRSVKSRRAFAAAVKLTIGGN
jgi:hypothetical protein